MASLVDTMYIMLSYIGAYVYQSQFFINLLYILFLDYSLVTMDAAPDRI